MKEVEHSIDDVIEKLGKLRTDSLPLYLKGVGQITPERLIRRIKTINIGHKNGCQLAYTRTRTFMKKDTQGNDVYVYYSKLRIRPFNKRSYGVNEKDLISLVCSQLDSREFEENSSSIVCTYAEECEKHGELGISKGTQDDFEEYEKQSKRLHGIINTLLGKFGYSPDHVSNSGDNVV